MTSAQETGKRVLQTEADALRLLADNLPEDFAPLVRRALATEGRIIVSGIGKSGHVGRKIAATLASTGAPAYFVHASEASHGDLGVISENDICLLISNSGETAELSDLIAYCRRFSIPLAAISSRPGSTLMQAADYRLVLPEAPEACSVGMAPTTSTTMSLALGDALAVALMEARGFDREHFSRFHPGGKLGAQMARVGALMHSGGELPLVASTASMAETLLVMTSKSLGIALVTDDEGRLAGVVTDGDLRRNMDGLMDRTAGQVATRDPIAAEAEMLAVEALALMNERKIAALAVIDAAGRPVGVLHVHDCLRVGVI